MWVVHEVDTGDLDDPRRWLGESQLDTGRTIGKQRFGEPPLEPLRIGDEGGERTIDEGMRLDAEDRATGR